MRRRNLKRAEFSVLLDFQNNRLRAENERNSNYKDVWRELKKKDKRNTYDLRKNIEKQERAASSSGACPSRR